MTEYGVVSTGFKRKPLSVILAEREAANESIFGGKVIQTPQSPLGQINGILANLEAALWEIIEDVYQSYDPEQAEGLRLDVLARLRLIQRADGELDPSLKQAITNAGVANVRDADFYRALRNIDGVTWARIYSNDTTATDTNGLPRNSVAVLALGGADEDVATVARQFIVPGITAHGNTLVDTTVEGFCRSVTIGRPTVRRVRAELTVSKSPDQFGCPAPSDAAIAQTFADGFVGQNRPTNGAALTVNLARQIVSCVYPSVIVESARFAFDDAALDDSPLALGFYELASVLAADVTIVDAA